MFSFASLRASRGWFAILAALLGLPLGARATEILKLGTYDSTPTFQSSIITLNPNQAGQQIKIYASGGASIPGINLALTIQDGGTGSATLGPPVTNVDLLTGTIFQSSGDTPVKDPLNGGQYYLTTLELGTNVNLGSGSNSVLVGTATLTTVGVAPGSYSFAVDGKYNGTLVTDPSDFADEGAGGPLALGNATLVVTPEPASLALLGLLLPACLLRRPRRLSAT